MICDEDGMREALEDAGIMERMPLMQWAAITDPERGEGTWEACSKGGYNAATYELVMPDIDSDLWLAIWKDGHVDSGSPNGICACLAR